MGKVIWKDGTWAIDGEPPNGLRFLNGAFQTRDGEGPPECFGVLWDGLGAAGAEDCKLNCDFSPVCMELTAKQELPAAQIRVGAGHTLPQLAEEMDIGGESVLGLMAYTKGGANPLEVRPKKKAPPPAEKQETAPEAPVAPEAHPDNPAPVSEAPVQEQAVSKAKSEKQSPKASKPVGPQKAPSAKRAKAGAIEKVLRNVKPARARAGSTRTKHWGEHTFQKRYERERDRSELISALKPGMTLNREYLGKQCPTKVLKVGYEAKGQVVPTLYMAVLLYTGTEERPKEGGGTRQVANYSAAKFYNLAKLLTKLSGKAKAPKAKPVKTKPKASKATKVKAKPKAKPKVKAPELAPPPVESLPPVASSDPPPPPPEVMATPAS